MMEELSQAVGVVDLLSADPRPSFIVELQDVFRDTASQTPIIAYGNQALLRDAALAPIFTTSPPSQRDGHFWRWVKASAPGADPSMPFLGVYWTRSVVNQRWVVVSGNFQLRSPSPPSPPPPPPPPPPRNATLQEPREFVPPGIVPAVGTNFEFSHLSRVKHSDTHIRRINSEPVVNLGVDQRCETVDRGWIVPPFTADQEPFLDVVANVDWASTPLGPIESWPPRLHQTFSQILVDSRSIAIYWGPEHTTIYNEAFSTLCGCRHPSVLGKPVDAVWPGKGELLRTTMRESAQKQRASTENEELSFFVENADGTLRETYLKWSIIPITENNQVLGFMHSVIETTSMRLWERRMKMLIDLGEVLVTARDVKAYWRKTLEDLEAVEPRYDIPIAILYSVHEGANTEHRDAQDMYDSTKVCHLEGSLGVPPGHPIIPTSLNLRTSEEGLSCAFRDALKELKPVSIRTTNGSFPLSLLKGLEWRGFGDPCQEALVVPIRPTNEEDVMGILLLGLNPRRPYDNGYRQYISLLNQKLTTSLASTVLLEKEARRGRNAAEQAAYDQAMLKEKLDARTREATEFIGRFEAVAQFIPVGTGFGDAQGNVTFANDAWFRITGLPPRSTSEPAGTRVTSEEFLEQVVEEDRLNVQRAYEELQKGRNTTFEFRVKPRADNGRYQPSSIPPPSFEEAGLTLVGLNDESAGEHHVLASAKAERSADGEVIRILTCLTDVTLHKRTAEEAVRRAQQAENLKRMAEFATVGMYDMDLEGRLLGANKVFYEMCGVDRSTAADRPANMAAFKPLHDCVVAEDFPLLEQTFSQLLSEGKPQTAEMRFKNPWTVEDNAVRVVAPRWVLATFMPVRSSDGQVQSFTGCLSDVSLQKWQLERERQRKEEAIESRRQQESFIDMTSHEMRNPLSAIIHCADAVIASLSRVQQLEQASSPSPSEATAPAISPASTDDKPHGSVVLNSSELVKNGIENAETIILCAQHQKRIVDDILTMSKLDSKLLVVTPITANPVLIVQEALKMFEVEARRVDIDLSMVINRSYHDLGIDYLDFDPSRVRQVLINLLTNALKFTTSGPTRNVTVGISASRSRPTEATSPVQFIPRSEVDFDDNAASDEAEGGAHPAQQPRKDQDSIFVVFEVRDTGQGLNEEEKKILFQRFVQASSRTHIKYGGSGLGLFISRRLAEMQNGAIGVASLPGVGSTFAFYIETFRPSEAAVREARLADETAEALSLQPRGLGVGVVGESIAESRVVSHVAQSLTGLASASQLLTGGGLLQPAASVAAKEPDITGILVVEDNLINQQITRRGLVDRGYEVQVANHGLEALEALKLSDRFIGDGDEGNDSGFTGPQPSATSGVRAAKKPFPLSVILMDMEMPIQDGLTCTREIRELEARGRIRGGRVPIIAVSANARMEQLLEAKAAGCDDVLVKPYRMPELIEKMKIVNRALASGGGGQVGKGGQRT